MGDTVLLVRLVAASALVGLLVFCVAHTVQVWRKRNAKKAGPDGGSPVGRRLAWGCLIAGVVLLPASAVHQEMTRRDGVLTGKGLFILRAQEDLNVEWLRDGDGAGAGEVLARFGSASRSARADELQARLARAEAERDVLGLLPLIPDPELTRRYQTVTQERTQTEQELGQAVIALEVAGRDLTAQLFNRKEALAKLDLTLTERRKAVEHATLKSSHARQKLSVSQSLAASGSVSAGESQDRILAARDAEVELASLTQEVKDLLAERDEVRTHLDKLETGRSDTASPLRTRFTTLTDRLARLEADETDLRAKVQADLARSTKLRDAEKAQADAKIREHQASLDSLTREREVLAPFPGVLAYRATSPNATRSRDPLAVLVPADGILLTARVAQSDADAIRGGAEVMIELGDDSPERRIPARFHTTTALVHEPGFAEVRLACQPPPEVVRRLADGEKPRVAFTWHPSLQAMWPFHTGVLLVAGGVFGLLLTGRRGFKRSQPPVVAPVHDFRPDVPTAEVRALLGMEPTDVPDTRASVEVWNREPVRDVRRTTGLQAVAGFLARLRQFRWRRQARVEVVRTNQFRQLRQILVAHRPESPLCCAVRQLPQTRS